MDIVLGDTIPFKPRPKCEQCGAASIVFRKDKTYICRRCGHDSRSEE